MNRAALYLRSSKDRSDVSIDVQRRQLTELAAARRLVKLGLGEIDSPWFTIGPAGLAALDPDR